MPFPNGIKVAGKVTPIQISQGLDVSTTSGTEYTVTYRGEAGTLFAAFDSLALGSARASYRQDGASATVEATFKRLVGGSVEQSIDTIELDFEERQVTIFRNPYYAALTASDIADIQATFDAIQAITGSDAAAGQQRDDERTALGLTTEGAKKVIALDSLLEGESTYTYLTPVLVYTQGVSIDYPVKMVLSDVGTIFSTATLPIPSVLFNLFNVPNVSNTIGVRPGYSLGWFKSARMQVVSDGGVQLIQKFTYDAFRTAHYSGTFDP